MSARIGERHVVISGLGQSEVGRRLGRTGYELTVDACLAALADAGLEPADIDGVATFPGAMDTLPGYSPVGVFEVQEALRLRSSWFNGGFESPGSLGSVITACAAVSAGYARHVLCFRCVTEGSAQGSGGRAGVTPGGTDATADRPPRLAGVDYSWFLPFGAASPVNWTAMYAQRHAHEYGTTRQQLAQIALTARANAARNPRALYRQPLSLDDYLHARMISSPLCLYDCDAPCDGATAIIVSSWDARADLRVPPVQVEAVGCASRGRSSVDQWEDLTTMAMRDAAEMLWSRSDLGPADVEVAELYDGFSFFTLAWLEALGFCGQGEGGPFIEGGKRIALDGDLPINTGGGQLSAGRLHGYGLLYQACRQLRGDAGDGQLDSRPEVALAAAGGGYMAGCLLLTRH